MTAPATEHFRAPAIHNAVAVRSPVWSDAVITGRSAFPTSRVLGVFPGEGIGPEVIHAALRVLDALEAVRPTHIRRIIGGPPGHNAHGARDGGLTQEASSFCNDVFAQEGALLCGPGGGRFVYDLRRQFDLYCKIAPLKPSRYLHHLSRIRRDVLAHVDILVVRDNAGGVYQGAAEHRRDPDQGAVAEQKFSYTESQVRRILEAGARLARQRSGHMHVVIKDGGVPAISELWRQVTHKVAPQIGVSYSFLNADYAAYCMIQEPQDIDVLVTPNMVGDILADLGAVFLGSRGLSYSGNFSACGRGVYQTGHGSAHDLTKTDRANPVAQILSLAMLLRESFGLTEEATLIERAVDDTWKAGWRTDDLREPGCRIVGLRDLAGRIADHVHALARKPAT